MPGEYEPQKQIFMIWPERPDNWRDGGKPAQKAFAEVAIAISEFEPVTMLVSQRQYENARNVLPGRIRVIEMSNNDAWVRDSGPTFLVNDKGDVRAVEWEFNAWAADDGLNSHGTWIILLLVKICEIENTGYILYGGVFLEGREASMWRGKARNYYRKCAFKPRRNPHLTKGKSKKS
jgi:agmatine deiminase